MRITCGTMATRSSTVEIPSPTCPRGTTTTPSSSATTTLPPLMSPTGIDHPCQERMFPPTANDVGDDDTTAKVVFQDAEDTREDDVEELGEKLRSASMSASMSESIPEEEETHGSAGEIPSSPFQPGRSNRSVNDDDDEDAFEDAREEVQDSPVLQSTPPAAKESYVDSSEWRMQQKHIFVLSDAGKPIFALHGDEDELASLMAVMQALVSFVLDSGDSLRSFQVGGGKKVVFVNKGPLILVAVTRGRESVTQLSVQLTYIYNQILSVLTLSQLTRIFEQRKGYDLRRMIAGSERLISSLSQAMDTDPCFMLSAVRVLPLPAATRDEISKTISKECSRAKNVVFAILIIDNQLVTLVRMKKYFIHPADLHLIFNLVNSTESFKISETWIPICMPKFDSSGFMHAHVSYLSDDCQACLVMLTVERDVFYELSEARGKIVASLEKSNSLKSITDALANSFCSPASLGFPEIRHFLYKAKTAAQFTSCKRLHPYLKEPARSRLHGIYLQMQNRLHSPQRPLKLIYTEEHHENVLGWVTQSFEMYSTFAPTTSKAAAITSVNKLLKWCKKEEGTLFILNAPTF